MNPTDAEIFVSFVISMVAGASIWGATSNVFLGTATFSTLFLYCFVQFNKDRR